MLGLGNSLIKGGTTGPTIITDGLVLKHNYDAGAVVPVSDGAAYFDGDADKIAIGAKPVDTADATYCFWSKSDVTGDNRSVIGHGAHSVGEFSTNHSGTGQPLLYLESAFYQYWVDTGFSDDNKWHHWALVVDISHVESSKLYIDGVEIAKGSGQDSGGSATAYGNMNIGHPGSGSDGYKGYLANIGVWSGHLSQAQIKSIMNKNYAGLSAGETASLVSWWNLDSVIADYDTNDGLILDNHAGLGPELINLSNSDDYGGTGESGDFVVTGDQTATWTGNDIGNPQTSYEYLGLDLVVPVNALESGKIYKIQLISTNYQGVSSYGFSETGGASDSLRGSGNFNKTETFVSDGNAIRIFAYDSHSFDATISCKEVLGNPGDLT